MKAASPGDTRAFPAYPKPGISEGHGLETGMVGTGGGAWRPPFWQTIRILGACALAYAVTGLLALPEGYWAIITSVIVTQPGLSATLQAGRNRITGTIIGALAGFIVIEAVQLGWPLEPLFWGALVPLAVLTAIKPELRLSCVTLVVMVLIPGPATWHRPFDRVIAILIGTLASIVVSAVLFPRPEAAVPEAPPAKDGGERAE
jgi:uncharacterized membrane protein YccC